MDFTIPAEIQTTLEELDEFIEREIKPLELEDDNMRFFDHRREWARTDFDMRDVFKYINELTLFGTQWQFKKGGVKPAEYAKQIADTARPALDRPGTRSETSPAPARRTARRNAARRRR